MSVDYNNLLTVEQKQNILNGNLQQFAAQAYVLELNKKAIIAAASEGSDEKVAVIDSDIKSLTQAISVYQEELATLNG